MRQQKAAHERQIFRRFAKAADLRINPRSIRTRRSPGPDISCRVDGVRRYFELTRMTHPAFANARGHHLSQMRRSGITPPPEADIYDDRLALRETIGRKAAKHYDTACKPPDLLIYIDGVFHPPRMRPEWAQTILQEEGATSRWAGLWLYDAVYDKVVATWVRD